MNQENGSMRTLKGVAVVGTSFAAVFAVAMVAWASQAKDPTTRSRPSVRHALAIPANASAEQQTGPTFGPMPDLGPSSRQQLYNAAPDFISVEARDGSGIAGYVAKADLFPDVAPGQPRLPGGVMTVYARDGVTVVGHFYPGKGFVSLSENPADVPNINPTPSVQVTPPAG